MLPVRNWTKREFQNDVLQELICEENSKEEIGWRTDEPMEVWTEKEEKYEERDKDYENLLRPSNSHQSKSTWQLPTNRDGMFDECNRKYT